MEWRCLLVWDENIVDENRIMRLACLVETFKNHCRHFHLITFTLLNQKTFDFCHCIVRRSDRRHVRLNDYSRSRKTLDQIILFYISDLHFCVKKKKKKIASNRRVATGKFSPLSYLEFYRRSRLISRITKLQKRRRNFLEDSIDRAPLSRGPIAYLHAISLSYR